MPTLNLNDVTDRAIKLAKRGTGLVEPNPARRRAGAPATARWWGRASTASTAARTPRSWR